MEILKKTSTITVMILLAALAINLLAFRVSANSDTTTYVVDEKISASFFVLKRDKNHLRASGDSRFYDRVMGRGLISAKEKYSDNVVAVENLIIELPDLTAVQLEENEEISWFRSKEISAKSWWIYGEIIEKTEPDEPSTSPELGDFDEPNIIPEAGNPNISEFEKGSVEEIIYKAIISGDSSTKDVSAYNLKSSDLYQIFNSIRNKEALIAYKTHLNLTYKTTAQKDIIQSFYLLNVDSSFLDSYDKVLKNIEIMQNGIDERMTDLEKVLYFHDYIAGITKYRTQNGYDKIASGPLARGYADCMGYSAALELMLELNNIEYQAVSSSAITHTWTLVKIENEWYHIDLTWDDTRSPSGEFSHTFFISTDYEFKKPKAEKNNHVSWGSEYVSYPESTSTVYETWFVHDVIGRMYYYNEEWYYSYNV